MQQTLHTKRGIKHSRHRWSAWPGFGDLYATQSGQVCMPTELKSPRPSQQMNLSKHESQKDVFQITWGRFCGPKVSIEYVQDSSIRRTETILLFPFCITGSIRTLVSAVLGPVSSSNHASSLLSLNCVLSSGIQGWMMSQEAVTCCSARSVALNLPFPGPVICSSREWTTSSEKTLMPCSSYRQPRSFGFI